MHLFGIMMRVLTMHSLCDDMHFCSLTITLIEEVLHRSGCRPQFLHMFSCQHDDWPLHGDSLLGM